MHVCLQENIVEYKHHKLARSLRSGPTDRDLKPNAATRDQLNVTTLSLLIIVVCITDFCLLFCTGSVTLGKGLALRAGLD